MSEAIAQRKPLPTGTVTFLFSDIEGSTERWERHREAMRASVRRHEELMRSAIQAHNGSVFKTIGDAFCAAFFSVADAIAAALDAQRALLGEDWSSIGGLKVRMAIHTGHTEERDGDYFGPAVNRVARLLAIGHGSQVLVSGASADLVQGEMPPQAALRDLGAHRLKDLTHPEQVYQLVAPELPAEFPPLRSLEALPNNLPLQLTSFVGRDIEILAVVQALAKNRLLTFVGSGGVGKTRLALQVGADLLDRYPDGVWLVELAPLTDGTLIPSSLASLFHVREADNRSLMEALIHALRPRRALIIFDNCEHLVEPAAQLIDTILRNCPHIRIIATSRQGLGIAGEVVHRVASLALPQESSNLRAEEALRYGAIALFVERAIAATESFRLTDRNAPVVARLCRRLDGIALAIELAAPRLKALSVEQLEAKLDERFRILTGGSRTALPRQQTMKALVDWSYELLTEDEKILFRRVAAFADSWSLDAASEVCSDEKLEAWTVLDLLQSLVDKSMVVAELSESEQRYRLLESTRQYALELLQKSGELEPLQTRHAAYFLRFAQAIDDAFDSTPTKAWMSSLQVEYDNLRAALEWALTAKRDVELGVALACALSRFWARSAYEAEGRRQFDAIITLVDSLPAPLQAQVWLGRSRVFGNILDWISLREIAERSLALNRAINSDWGTAESLMHLGETQLRMRQHREAEQSLSEALSIAEGKGNRRLQAWIKGVQARNLHFQDRPDEARHGYYEALHLARAQGDDWLKIVCMVNLAEMEFAAGRAQQALDLAREAEGGRALDYILTNNIAAYLIDLQRFDEARDAAARALRMAQDAHGPVFVAYSIQHLAAITASQGKTRQAARLIGYCNTAYELDGWVIEYTERQEYEKLQHLFEQELQPDELRALLAEGAAMGEEQAVSEALLA